MQVLLLKMGTVALDGTKIHANASKHSALSYEHAGVGRKRAKGQSDRLLAYVFLMPDTPCITVLRRFKTGHA